MFKKRSLPTSTTRKREELDAEDEANDEAEEALSVDDLVALRNLKRGRQGIDAAKLIEGDRRKRKKRSENAAGDEQFGLIKQAIRSEEEQQAENEAAKARKAIRSNNFTQQTNTLDVDKHMMKYIEENLKTRAPTASEPSQDPQPANPHDDLYRITATAGAKTEASAPNSLAMLTAIPEVDLGMMARLKNIEETEKARRTLADGDPGSSPGKVNKDSSNAWMRESATDDMVLERFKKRMKK